MSQALALHNGPDVREVQIDHGRQRDKVADALDALAQDVVRVTEGVFHGGRFGYEAQQLFIGHYYQRVHVGLQFRDALFGVLHALTPLKGERLGHDAYGQDTLIAGDLRYDGSRAGAGAAAHTAGHEYQIRALDDVEQLLTAFLSGALAYVRIRSRAQTLGKLLADLNLHRRFAQLQSLLIGIYRDELHAFKASVQHAVNRVGSRASYTNYLYRGKIGCVKIILQHKASP